MNRLSITVCMVAALLATAPALAQNFNLSWRTIDGGGNASTGNGFTLTGTIGQPDASASLSGSAYGIAGGFWYADVVPSVCPADIFPASESCDAGDGIVGPGDLALLLASWGSCPDCCADLAPSPAGDGVVGPADLAALLAVWGQCG